MRLIAEQPILVYPGKSKSLIKMIRRGGEHPVMELKIKYPDWSEEILQLLPYWMKVRVEVLSALTLSPDHLKRIRRDLKEIVLDLPSENRQPYQFILKEMKKRPELMDIPRMIEYMVMAEALYVLDCIKILIAEPEQKLKNVVFHGLTLPSYQGRAEKRDYNISSVWIFHNYGGPAIDLLLIECLHLAVDKINNVIQGKDMDLLKILKIKCNKFKPVSPLSKEKKKQSRFRRDLKKILSLLNSTKSFLFVSNLP